MARAKLRCIMGCPGLQSSYQEKSLLSMSLFFYKLLLKIIKIDVKVNKTLKLKFMLMLFDRVYPRRPSDTVTKYIYSLSHILLIERLFKWSWVLLCYLILWLAKRGSKISCFLLFEIEYLLKLVSNNLPFLSRPSDTKIQTAIT